MDCTLTALGSLIPDTSSGVMLLSWMGGATFGAIEPCPITWGMASIEELERGESGLESSVINREAKLQEPLGALALKHNSNTPCIKVEVQ